MKNYKLYLFLLSFYLSSCQEYGKFKLLDQLPAQLDEVSGMEIVHNSNVVFAINDSGNAPILYLYDRNDGLSYFKSDLLVNNDWEDLTYYHDSITNKEYLYIADTGNNDNSRKDLAIYQVDITDFDKKEIVNLNIRKQPFYYKSQKKYPPRKKELEYDCEAIIRIGNYFYLFSKNRSSHFNGKSQVYRLGIHENEAIKIQEIELCNDDKGCLVTSADVSTSGRIALLTSDKVFIISDYDLEFNTYKIKRYDLNHFSQKESITFIDENTLLISDEKESHSDGNLYVFKLED